MMKLVSTDLPEVIEYYEGNFNGNPARLFLYEKGFNMPAGMDDLHQCIVFIAHDERGIFRYNSRVSDQFKNNVDNWIRHLLEIAEGAMISRIQFMTEKQKESNNLAKYGDLPIGTICSYWHTAVTCLWTVEKISDTECKVLKENPSWPVVNAGKIEQLLHPDDIVSLNKHL